MKIQSVVLAIIKKENTYLMTKRVSFDKKDEKFYPFVWNIPGGGLQFGETPLQALLREVREELQIELTDIIQVSKVFTDIRNNWQGLFIPFLCFLKNKDAKIILNNEASEYGWYTLEDARKLKTMKMTIEMLMEADQINPDHKNL